MAESASTAPLLYGTVFFFVLGIAGCIGVNFAVRRATEGAGSQQRLKRFENRSLVIIVVTMSVFCMWLQWICAYMHQMNPITPPIPETFTAE